MSSGVKLCCYPSVYINLNGATPPDRCSLKWGWNEVTWCFNRDLGLGGFAFLRLCTAHAPLIAGGNIGDAFLRTNATCPNASDSPGCFASPGVVSPARCCRKEWSPTHHSFVTSNQNEEDNVPEFLAGSPTEYSPVSADEEGGIAFYEVGR